jgi:hypothetical protein
MRPTRRQPIFGSKCGGWDFGEAQGSLALDLGAAARAIPP